MVRKVDLQDIESIIFKVMENNSISSPTPETPLTYHNIVAVEALMEIEDYYDIELSDKLFEKCLTVRDLSELALTYIM